MKNPFRIIVICFSLAVLSITQTDSNKLLPHKVILLEKLPYGRHNQVGCLIRVVGNGNVVHIPCTPEWYVTIEINKVVTLNLTDHEIGVYGKYNWFWVRLTIFFAAFPFLLLLISPINVGIPKNL